MNVIQHVKLLNKNKCFTLKYDKCIESKLETSVRFGVVCVANCIFICDQEAEFVGINYQLVRLSVGNCSFMKKNSHSVNETMYNDDVRAQSESNKLNFIQYKALNDENELDRWHDGNKIVVCSAGGSNLARLR